LDSYERRLGHLPEKDRRQLRRRVLLLGLLGRTCVVLILLSLPVAAALLVAASVFAGGPGSTWGSWGSGCSSCARRLS
jgi:hypothetical protein